MKKNFCLTQCLIVSCLLAGSFSFMEKAKALLVENPATGELKNVTLKAADPKEKALVSADLDTDVEVIALLKRGVPIVAFDENNTQWGLDVDALGELTLRSLQLDKRPTSSSKGVLGTSKKK